MGAIDRLTGRILMGFIAGLLAAIGLRFWEAAWPGARVFNRALVAQLLDPAGQIFLRLLFFVVVPLVFASLALGILQLGRLEKLGPMAWRTFALFAVNMAIGAALALLMMNLLAPGRRFSPEARAQIEREYQESASVLARAPRAVSVSLASLVEMFMPRNLLQAIVQFEVLPLILFALLVGAAGTGLAPPQRVFLETGLETVLALMTGLVQFALRLAPYAVGALIASATLKFGLELMRPLGLFVAGVLATMALHLFGTMSLLLLLFSRRSPRQFFSAVRTILVTAFSTSSSNATLPTTIHVSREKLGISAPTAGFVLPLGATMNMSGSALYEGCVVLFVAQVYGMSFTLPQQVILVLLAVLSAVAVAGIPGGSLPLIVGLLATFGLPAEGIALILGTDRFLDMARTVLNVAADVVTACIVDEHLEAEGGSEPEDG